VDEPSTIAADAARTRAVKSCIAKGSGCWTLPGSGRYGLDEDGCSAGAIASAGEASGGGDRASDGKESVSESRLVAARWWARAPNRESV